MPLNLIFLSFFFLQNTIFLWDKSAPVFTILYTLMHRANKLGENRESACSFQFCSGAKEGFRVTRWRSRTWKISLLGQAPHRHLPCSPCIFCRTRMYSVVLRRVPWAPCISSALKVNSTQPVLGSAGLSAEHLRALKTLSGGGEAARHVFGSLWLSSAPEGALCLSSDAEHLMACLWPHPTLSFFFFSSEYFFSFKYRRKQRFSEAAATVFIESFRMHRRSSA